MPQESVFMGAISWGGLARETRKNELEEMFGARLPGNSLARPSSG
jgi:hypothetical protein